MSTVFSNFHPAKITDKSLGKVWLDLFLSSEEVLMATGYVSHYAVKVLQEVLEQQLSIQTVKLLVGMHYLEGFSLSQYRSLCELNEFLQSQQRGAVYVSPFTKFHGKMYSFKYQGQVNGLIGSANLTCFWDKTERTYETMFLLEDSQTASKLRNNIQETISSLGKPIHLMDKPTIFVPHNIHLDNCLNVEQVDKNKVAELFKQSSLYQFPIPAKYEVGSNLNCFCGKGRGTKRGNILIRSWYEVELIVPSDIVRQEGYPANRSFQVITDDGWSFPCYSSSKNKGITLSTQNFRSKTSLAILGKWIKGRLEVAGCLKTGEIITAEILQEYGNDHFELRSTDNPDVWLLSFKGKGA